MTFCRKPAGSTGVRTSCPLTRLTWLIPEKFWKVNDRRVKRCSWRGTLCDLLTVERKRYAWPLLSVQTSVAQIPMAKIAIYFLANSLCSSKNLREKVKWSWLFSRKVGYTCVYFQINLRISFVKIIMTIINFFIQSFYKKFTEFTCADAFFYTLSLNKNSLLAIQLLTKSMSKI